MDTADHTQIARPNVVLFSGGIDSAAIAWQFMLAGVEAELLFVDYGQPPRASERRAATALAGCLNARLSQIEIRGVVVAGRGEIPFRNALLVTAAAAAVPTAATISIGIHAGTDYYDCSPDFVRIMQTVLDAHGHDSTRLTAPFAESTKLDLIGLAAELGVPFDLTHSCEFSDEACLSCSSCLDRMAGRAF